MKTKIQIKKSTPSAVNKIEPILTLLIQGAGLSTFGRALSECFTDEGLLGVHVVNKSSVDGENRMASLEEAALLLKLALRAVGEFTPANKAIVAAKRECSYGPGMMSNLDLTVQAIDTFVETYGPRAFCIALSNAFCHGNIFCLMGLALDADEVLLGRVHEQLGALNKLMAKIERDAIKADKARAERARKRIDRLEAKWTM